MSNDLGKALVKNKHFGKALFVFKKILKKNPSDLRANFQIGKIFYELNDLNKSLLFFQKCDEIQPNKAQCLHRRVQTEGGDGCDCDIYDGKGEKSFTEIEWKGNNILLFGSEGFGIKKHTEKYADFLVKIEINEKIESLNISNSAAIVFHYIMNGKK